MISVAICDDDKLFLCSIAEQLSKKYENEIVFKTYTKCRDLLYAVEYGEDYFDSVLMDVKFDDGDGIEVIKKVQQLSPQTRVIYITGYIETSMRIFETKPSNFLVKPVTYNKVVDAIEKIRQEILLEQKEYITIRTAKRAWLRIPIRDIRYVESDKRKLILYTRNTSYEIYDTLNAFEAELVRIGVRWFVRCHQSYLLNMHFILEKKTSVFVLTSGEDIPISRSRHENTEKKI